VNVILVFVAELMYLCHKGVNYLLGAGAKITDTTNPISC
jgi:hypothetical protein